MTKPPVLVVGAGPTGLMLALQLARRGAPVRIISQAHGPGETSRAMAVHARTLEFYSQLGFAQEVVEAGVAIEAVHILRAVGGAAADAAVLQLKDFGLGQSPYPFILAFPQDDHERLLERKLNDAGVEVDWGLRLDDYVDDGEGVSAQLSRNGGARTELRASYLCGCDGAHSRTRRILGARFEGGDYEQLFYVADVEVEGGFVRDMRVSPGANALTLLLPVRSRGVQRLIGLVPAALADRPDLGFEDLREGAEAAAGVRVRRVNWFSTYRSHHRVADRFGRGRVFLLGDAGHIHSPAGGQGMKTGVGDAANLGWKLAQTLTGRSGPGLLDTYEEERLRFARALVRSTDRAFQALVSEGPFGEVLRRRLAPGILEAASRLKGTRREAFRILSQIHISYRNSALSAGRAGGVRGGDRLPWTGAGASGDNFAPLRSLDWQVHVYGAPSQEMEKTCARLALPLHAFASTDGTKAAGFKADALYLVRPDGRVALAADGAAAPEAFTDFTAATAAGFRTPQREGPLA